MPRTTEAFQVYHFQKERLTNYLQVSSAGLSLLRRTIDTSNAPALLGALVDGCGVKHWSKGKQYKGAIEQVDFGVSALAELGVIQHVAAFDIFTRSAVLDISRFSSQARAMCPRLGHDHALLRLSSAKRWVSNHCCNDVAGKLDTLSKRLEELETWTGWKPSEKLKPTLPLFDLIRSIRNRIAHDGGIVGSDLEEMAVKKETLEAFSSFQKNYARSALPSLPDFIKGKSLGIEVIHSILFGAFLYEVANEINQHACDLIEDDEFIDMAFYYSCVAENHPLRTISHRNPESRVRHFLTNYARVGVPAIKPNVIHRLMSQKIGDGGDSTTLWKVASVRHKELLIK